VTLSALDLDPVTGGVENVQQWYFNLNTTMLASSLVFTAVNATAVTGPSWNTTVLVAPDTGANQSTFDFRFTTTGTSFQNGESVVYDISRAGGLTALDFNFLSSPTPDAASFLSVALIDNGRGGANNRDNWVRPTQAILSGDIPPAVPEPTSILLMGTGLAYMGNRLRRTRKKRNSSDS
jgi:hypothetical protein